ncbi:MAG: hypothetical protein L3J89_01400 [Gammaproteobacteria bacterium]|nr:hypothetical protein [Gammaproteobacteria bacterium]
MFLSDKKWIDHPGSFIREELEAREWSQIDLAYILGCTVQSVNLLVNEKKGISPDMAKSLGMAFSVSPEFLNNLQKIYELSRADEPSKEIEKRAKLQRYPLKLMSSRGWIEETDDVCLMEAQLSRFFEVESIDETPQLAHAAKATLYSEMPVEQLVWLFRVRQIAKEIVVPEYSKKSVLNLVEKLKNLRNEPEQIRHVPRLLAECGIRFAVVEALPKSKIDGVCFWLDESSPVVGMTTLHDRIDNFWFVLRHELEHVIREHGKEHEIIDIELGKEKEFEDEDEKVANLAGANFCVNQEKMNSFYLRKAPYISDKDVIAFASLQEVHPGLVVGQIHNRTKKWHTFRKHLVPIRGHIVKSAIVDGWGEVAPTEL